VALSDLEGSPGLVARGWLRVIRAVRVADESGLLACSRPESSRMGAVMGIVRCDITVSLDGCMAASGQSLENPMGEGGMRTMAWHGSELDASPFTGTPTRRERS
jgi:hypothetical protein